jgi:NADH-quinone oxidoreductase subunit N
MDVGGTLIAILPEIVVTLTAMAVLFAEIALPRRRGRALTIVTVGGILAALAASVLLGRPATAFGGFVIVDALTTFFRVLFLLLALIAALGAEEYAERRRLPYGDLLAVLLFSTLGAMTVVLAGDLITFFVGIELMSIPVYVLAGLQRRNTYSNEAALKYFLLGAFSSAILLYGLTWLYGVAGTTELAAIPAALGSDGLAGAGLIALAFTVVGLGFKAAIVPFHQWTPDAYEGAPTPVTAFMSVGPKAAAFAGIIRLVGVGLAPLVVDWAIVFALLAALTMTFGNVVAIAQTSVKRMLAYSSIAHTGYILAGVAAAGAGASAWAGVLFYAFAYGIMNIGAFATLLTLDTEGTRGATLEEMNGLSRRAPLIAVSFALLLFSLTGLPPTVGFFAKYFVFIPALNAGLGWLAVLMALNSALAAFYYLRVVVHMYMLEPEGEIPELARGPLLGATVTITALATLVLFVWSDPLYRWALSAAEPVLR